MKTLGIALLVALGVTVVTARIVWNDADASHWCNDGATYRFQGNSLARGFVFAPAPPLEKAFSFAMVLVHEGKWFGQYYPGYPLLLGAGVATGLDWFVNPLFAGLLVLATFLLARRLFDPEIGLMAAILLAGSPLLLAMATTYLSHVVCAVFLTFAAFAVSNGAEGSPWRWGLVAGFLFGWGTAVRPFTGLLLGPVIALFLIHRVWFDRASWRLPVAFCLAAIPWGLALLAWNRVLTGEFFTSPYELKWPLHGLGFHEIPPQRRFLPGTEITFYSPSIAWIATKRQLAGLAEKLLSLPFSALFLLPLPVVFARSLGKRGLLLGLFAIGLVAGHFFYPGTLGVSVVALGPRYYTESLPALALLVAAPLGTIARASVGARAAVWVLVGVSAAFATFRTIPAISDTTASLHVSPLSGANRHLERHLRELGPGSRVIFVDISTYHRASALLVNRPDLSGENVVAVYREPEENRRVLEALPDREAFLMRWDEDQGGVVLTAYDPDQDTEGPPDRFPYTRARKKR